MIIRTVHFRRCNSLLFPLKSLSCCVLLSFHLDFVYIFFYQGASATVDVHEDILFRFAHADLYPGFINDADSNRFYVETSGYSTPPFEFRFETNTPFPYHAELHINGTRFDYEGEYLISYKYSNIREQFFIDVNSEFCMHAWL